jgi:hypothetical protein
VIPLCNCFIDTHKWPLGACMAQVAHSVSALLWTHNDNDNVKEYMNDMEHMRKVVLQVTCLDGWKNHVLIIRVVDFNKTF